MNLSVLYKNLEKYSSLLEDETFYINNIEIEKRKIIIDKQAHNEYRFHSERCTLQYDMYWEIQRNDKVLVFLIEINDEIPKLIRQVKINKVLNE